MESTIPVGNAIAIIGMAGRFPGAPDLDRFWENLRQGVESVTFFEDEELRAAGISDSALAQPGYVKARPVLADVERFDASFFGYAPREAALMDPQHRLFLESAWAALEDAGYAPGGDGRRIGVFAGSGENTYLLHHVLPHRELLEALGGLQITINSSKDYLCTRVSYKLNLRGPSLTVQTACSTSLVAVHLACQSLLNHECDMALAGAVAIRVPQTTGYLYQEGGLWSPDGHCRAFDARAQGTVFGSGLGIVVLKRLEDASADGDTIRAVIRGSAINNDGASKVGYTAPSIDGQAEVIAETLGVAQVEPETVGYIETHGTGTPLGDPIEIAALTQAFRERTGATGFCAIGSVKTNVGHLDTAAGMAGLLKAVLALEHRQIPPSLHFETNPRLDLSSTPFFVNTELAGWPATGAPPRAGVSSFGVGGTNAHVVLEAAPAPTAVPCHRPAQLLVLSATTRPALERATRRLRDHLERHPEQPWADAAYTLHVGRSAFAERRALVCRDRAEALQLLGSPGDDRVLEATAPGTPPPVVFMFPGQGTQYANMTRELYEVAAVFREQLDRCTELLRPRLGLDLRTVLFPEAGQEEWAGEQLEQTRLAQPALFAVEYALARLWLSWGLKPAALIGHSVGEYVAACLAGVLSLEDALALVAARGQLVQQLPAGAMLSVELPAAEVAPLLGKELALAAINGPRLCVVAGPEPAISALLDGLSSRGIGCRRLHTSHAFHSPMLEPILPAFLELCRRVRLQPPALPIISNVTGTWMAAAEATDPGYWARHLRQTVRFEEGLRTILASQEPLFLEVGPGRALSTFARQQGTGLLAVPSVRHQQVGTSDWSFLLTAVGRLWLAGAPVDWQAFHSGERRRRVPLPTYPFEPQRHWVEALASNGGGPLPEMGAAAPQPASHTDEAAPLPSTPAPAAPLGEVEQIVVDTWRELLGVEHVRPQDDFFELGGHSLLATRLLARLGERCQVKLSIGDLFAASTLAGLCRTLAELRASSSSGAARVAPAVDLDAEMVLDPALTASGLPGWAPGEPAAVLLTGATGFLGTFLLHDLLQQTRAKVYCLARAESDEEALQRLRRKLEEQGLWDAAVSGRILPVAGDLALPRLGLDPERFEELAGHVDAIYHNGSWVNWLYPYPVLKPSNVLGTQELLRLACTGKLKPLHYVSSVAVFDSHAHGASELCYERPAAVDGASFTTGYALAKWVSEKLLALAGERGIPTYVYRPAYVIGHSRTGACNTNDFLLRMVRGCLELRAAPHLDVVVNMAPVDYVSRALVHLSLQPEPPGTIFHLTNPVDASWLEIVDWMQRQGYELPLIPYGEWQAVLASQAGQDNALGPLRLLFPASESHSAPSAGQPQGRRYDCRETLSRLARTSIACPPIRDAQLELYFDHLVRSGYLEPPRR